MRILLWALQRRALAHSHVRLMFNTSWMMCTTTPPPLWGWCVSKREWVSVCDGAATTRSIWQDPERCQNAFVRDCVCVLFGRRGLCVCTIKLLRTQSAFVRARSRTIIVPVGVTSFKILNMPHKFGQFTPAHTRYTSPFPDLEWTRDPSRLRHSLALSLCRSFCAIIAGIPLV